MGKRHSQDISRARGMSGEEALQEEQLTESDIKRVKSFDPFLVTGMLNSTNGSKDGQMMAKLARMTHQHIQSHIYLNKTFRVRK